MGEVYRARDTRLDRDVAIKILPQAFFADTERVARFQREAKVLASLNHPNIGETSIIPGTSARIDEFTVNSHPISQPNLLELVDFFNRIVNVEGRTKPSDISWSPHDDKSCQ